MADRGGFEAMQKQRMEKDLQELQSLIAKHFEQRKDDDDDLANLEARITKRREEREKQQKIRQEREKARLQREKEERAKREEEEERRKKEEEEKKQKAIKNMGASYGGYLARNERKGGKRQTEREKKRKILSERRKPLNIDHLAGDKLRDKAGELFKWLALLEEERYDFEVVAERAKYDINALRQRVSEYMAKSGKGGKSQGSRQVKTLANVGAKAAAFK